MRTFRAAVDAVKRLDFDIPIDRPPPETNKEIMKGYDVLSDALAPLLHGTFPVANATFPTFVKWTAETLRPEIAADDGRPLQPYGYVRPARAIYRRVANAVMGNDDAIGRNLARGEAAIYAEVGTAIRSLLEVVLPALQAPQPGGDPDWTQVWTDYTSSLESAAGTLNDARSGDPNAIGATDVMVLQAAILPYFEALATGLTRDPDDRRKRKERAERILLGNIKLEAYAQTRVQPVLERNLSYVPDALRAVMGSRFTGRNTPMSNLFRTAYDRFGGASEGVVDEAFAITATRHVYSMVFGDETLTFGRDLPVPPPANPVLRDRQPELDRQRYAPGSFFPRDLQTLRSREVWAEWQQFDRSMGEGSRTAVDNWLRYEERMNFIANFMRSRQQLTALYGPPRSMPPALPPRPAHLAPAAPGISEPTQERVGIFRDRDGQGGRV
jgi:hypothetical protein